MRLKNKTALITGTASGIGRESALLFAREGASVVCADVQDATDTVQEITAAGGQAIACRADVSQAADCEAMVAAAVGAFGGLHILFNNAGVMLDDDDNAETGAPTGRSCEPSSSCGCGRRAARRRLSERRRFGAHTSTRRGACRA